MANDQESRPIDGDIVDNGNVISVGLLKQILLDLQNLFESLDVPSRITRPLPLGSSFKLALKGLFVQASNHQEEDMSPIGVFSQIDQPRHQGDPIEHQARVLFEKAVLRSAFQSEPGLNVELQMWF